MPVDSVAEVSRSTVERWLALETLTVSACPVILLSQPGRTTDGAFGHNAIEHRQARAEDEIHQIMRCVIRVLWVCLKQNEQVETVGNKTDDAYTSRPADSSSHIYAYCRDSPF